MSAIISSLEPDVLLRVSSFLNARECVWLGASCRAMKTGLLDVLDSPECIATRATYTAPDDLPSALDKIFGDTPLQKRMGCQDEGVIRAAMLRCAAPQHVTEKICCADAVRMLMAAHRSGAEAECIGAFMHNIASRVQPSGSVPDLALLAGLYGAAAQYRTWKAGVEQAMDALHALAVAPGPAPTRALVEAKKAILDRLEPPHESADYTSWHLLHPARPTNVFTLCKTIAYTYGGGGDHAWSNSALQEALVEAVASRPPLSATLRASLSLDTLDSIGRRLPGGGGELGAVLRALLMWGYGPGEGLARRRACWATLDAARANRTAFFVLLEFGCRYLPCAESNDPVWYDKWQRGLMHLLNPRLTIDDVAAHVGIRNSAEKAALETVRKAMHSDEPTKVLVECMIRSRHLADVPEEIRYEFLDALGETLGAHNAYMWIRDAPGWCGGAYLFICTPEELNYGGVNMAMMTSQLSTTMLRVYGL